MVSVQGAAAFGLFLSGAVLVGNHYFIKTSWKEKHPLVTESIELLLRDPAVVRELGPKIVKKGSKVDGVLDSGRNWANFNFQVEGTVKAKVCVVADAKPASEVTEDEHYTGAYQDYSSTLMVLYNYFIEDSNSSKEMRWKIANLTLTIDDWVNIEVINSTKKYQDLIKKEKIVEVQSEQQSVGMIRRKKQMDTASYYYWKMVFGGVFTLAAWIYLSSLYIHKPVINSVLLNKSLEILKTSEITRKHIGLPIHNFQAIKGFMNHNSRKGSMTYYIYGPLGFAKVDISGKFDKKSKVWNFEKFVVQKENNKFEVLS